MAKTLFENFFLNYKFLHTCHSLMGVSLTPNCKEALQIKFCLIYLIKLQERSHMIGYTEYLFQYENDFDEMMLVTILRRFPNLT